MTDDPFGGEQDGVELGVLLRRAFGIVRRHKWWIVFPAALALVPAVMLPFTLPDEYSAIASIEVTGRPEILDVDADPLSEGVTGSRRAPLAPYVAVALSDQVLREVVSDEPVAPTTARRPGLLRRLKMKLGLQGPDMASLTPEQQLGARIEGLRQQLVAYEQDSLLKIMALGETPTEVASLANAVSDSLVRHSNRRREQAAADAMSVFNTSVYDYRERIDRRKQEIAELMKRTGLRPDNMDTAPAELAMLNRDLDITRRQLREVRLRIAMLRERIERPNESSVESEVVAQQRERLSQALQELANARLQYTPSAPQVRRLEKLVEDLRVQLGPAIESAPPATLEEKEDYRRLQAEERSLNASAESLERELKSLGSFDPEKADAIIEYQRLVRELEIDERQLRDFLERRSRLQFDVNTEYAGFRILDYAIPPIGPSGPERGQWLLLGIVLALGVGMGVGVLRELLDQTIREPEEAANVLNVAVLGMIPRIHDGTPPERQSDGPPSSLAAESYRNLRTALLFTGGGQQQGSLLVTSATAGEGKTTVSCNLASSFAQAGRRIVLVDADMRLPRVHKVMGMTPSPGLAELIRGDASLDEGIRRPTDGRFDVITAGRVPPNPSELLASSDFVMVLARLKAMYDLVLIDCPVLLGVSDACIIGTQIDGALLVHRPGSVEKRALSEIRQQLTRAGVNLMGLAFNMVDRNDRHFYPLYLESPYVSKGGKGVKVRRSSTSPVGRPVRRRA